MIEVGATERAIIRYCKFGRRLVRDARLREFLLLHLNTILKQYAPMLALTDEQIANDQVGGRVGLELSDARFKIQRGPFYVLHRRQFFKRPDAYEILLDMRQRIIKDQGSLWRTIAKLAFHKHNITFAIRTSISTLARDYQVILMFASAVREYTTRHPEAAKALHVSNRRTDLLYHALIRIEQSERQDLPDSLISTDSHRAEDSSYEDLLEDLELDSDMGMSTTLDDTIETWKFQRKHLWQMCSLVPVPGGALGAGTEGFTERLLYAVENLASSPYAIRYTWEIDGDGETLPTSSIITDLDNESRLFEFGHSGVYLVIKQPPSNFFSMLKFDSVATQLIYGENEPNDEESALKHFLNSVRLALANTANKSQLGVPQERSSDEFKNVPSERSFRRYFGEIKDVIGEMQIQLLFSEGFLEAAK